MVIHGGLKKYDEISFLKGFSILLIMFMHLIQGYMTWLPGGVMKAASFGGSGVHVFFFCSGFGLYISYQKKQKTYLRFVIDKISKIYWPYILVIILCYLTPFVQISGNKTTALMSHLFFFKMFSPVYEESFGPFWFMSTIIQLYVVFVPLELIRSKIGCRRFFFLSLLISTFWWIFTASTGLCEQRIWGSFFLQYIWEFSLGMCVAEYLSMKQQIKLNNRVLVICCILGIALEAGLASVGGSFKSLNDIPALVGCGSLGLLFFQINPIKRAGLFLGSFSYELYLVHMYIFVVCFHFFEGYTAVFLSIILSMIVAYVYHLLIVYLRNKCMRLKCLRGQG